MKVVMLSTYPVIVINFWFAAAAVTTLGVVSFEIGETALFGVRIGDNSPRDDKYS
jgi:hypothetical protein